MKRERGKRQHGNRKKKYVYMERERERATETDKEEEFYVLLLVRMFLIGILALLMKWIMYNQTASAPALQIYMGTRTAKIERKKSNNFCRKTNGIWPGTIFHLVSGIFRNGERQRGWNVKHEREYEWNEWHGIGMMMMKNNDYGDGWKELRMLLLQRSRKDSPPGNECVRDVRCLCVSVRFNRCMKAIFLILMKEFSTFPNKVYFLHVEKNIKLINISFLVHFQVRPQENLKNRAETCKVSTRPRKS